MVTRPVVPFIEYAINFEYIKEVLCINKENRELKCDGKCHLNEQLSKSTNEPGQNNPDLPTITVEKVIGIANDLFHYSIYGSEDRIIKHAWLYHFSILQCSRDKLLNPPQA